MKNLIRLFIIAAIGVLMACYTTPVFSADDTGGLGATIEGADVHTMSLVNTTLSYEDPGEMGIVTYTLSGGPVEIIIEDNNYDPGSGSDVAFVTVGISSGFSNPQYGIGGTYWLITGTPTWTPAADNEYTPVNVGGGYPLTDGATPIAGILSTDSPAGIVLHGEISQDILLQVQNNKRMAGDTSDSYVLTYTFYEY